MCTVRTVFRFTPFATHRNIQRRKPFVSGYSIRTGRAVIRFRLPVRFRGIGCPWGRRWLASSARVSSEFLGTGVFTAFTMCSLPIDAVAFVFINCPGGACSAGLAGRFVCGADGCLRWIEQTGGRKSKDCMFPEGFEAS